MNNNKYDDLQKLADLKDKGAITIEEFEWQKSKLLNELETEKAIDINISEKSRLVAFLLCFFFGVIGVHRFYVRKVGTGIVQILTLGGLGVWTLIDMIIILAGSFKDKDGKVIKNWNDE